MIRVISTSLACIFGYSDAVDRRDLTEYLKDKGFTIPHVKREEIITSSGLPIGEAFAEPPIVAYRVEDGNKIDVLYNNNANLIGFPSSSFVTVVSRDFDSTYSVFELIYNYLSDKKLDRDIKIYEATFTGLVEKEGLKERIQELFVSDKLSKFKKVLHQSPILTSYRVRGDNPREPGWYDLLIDTAASENPKLSLVRLVIRYADYYEYTKLRRLVEEVVEVMG